MKKKFIYSTGKKGFRKPACEYDTDGKEFDTYHRFTDKEVKILNELEVGKTVKIFDEFFKADEIRIKRVE